MCAEKGFLSHHYPTSRILRHSFRIKFCFLVAFVGLSAAFTGTMYEQIYAPSVILEWLLGVLLALYMWSCAIDFFAEPESGDRSDLTGLLAKEWDEEAAITCPKKVRFTTNVHKHYVELP